MAFVLRKIGPNTFAAAPGRQFTIRLDVDRGVLMGVLARYDGQPRSTNPFAFPVAQTTKNLVTNYIGTDPNAIVNVREIDGAQTQLLTQRFGNDMGFSLVIQPGAAPVLMAAAKKKAPAKKAPVKKNA